MQDLLEHLLVPILEILGMATEDAGERVQTIALTGGLALFCLVAGFVFSGVASALFFVIAGLLSVTCILAGYGIVGL